MLTDDILKSAQYYNFVDKINSLSNELLYGKSGYLLLKSFEAIKNKDVFVQKFNFEANKIKNEYNYSDSLNYVDFKKKSFISSLEKHFQDELYVWIDEIYENLCENYLLELSINKTLAQEIFSILSDILNWYCSIKNIDDSKINDIKKQLNLKFQSALKSQDIDYLNSLEQVQTKPKVFIDLWKKILNSPDEFVDLNLNQFLDDLSKNDINFFNSIKQKLFSFKREVVLDEINLIEFMLSEFKIDSFDEKYQIIQSIYRDFSVKQIENKTLSEEDKIKIIKRRLEIAFDRKNKTSNFYKKVTSSFFSKS